VWGGWWFWVPVESAALLRWLIGSAIIQALAATEARGLFKSGTVLLAVAGFSLSLLGTFLVRSGVLVSVHAFATDPSRGLFILMFLLAVIGGALGLYAWRARLFQSTGGFAIASRESFLLVNNALLVVATGLILIGTLYPLFLDALNLGKISVGPPYFAIAFSIPMLPLVLLLAVGMHAGWKRANLGGRKRLLMGLGVGALIAGALLLWVSYGQPSVLTVVGFAAGLWVVLASLLEPVSRLRKGHSLSAGVLGMSVAHLGLGLFVIGATTVESFKIEQDVALRPGETASIAGYDFHVKGFRDVEGPNYQALEGEVEVTRDGKRVTVLYPQKRIYRVQTNPMTEAGIQGRWNRDLHVAMGEPLGEDAWSMRLQYKPLIRFIWWGCGIMALGGLIGVCDRRYRQRATAGERAAVGAADPEGAGAPAMSRSS